MESYKLMDAADDGTGADGDFCKACGRLSPEIEEKKVKLLAKQEKLLKDIKSTKVELVQKIDELKAKQIAKGEGNESDPEAVFNMKNLKSFQELLDHAEETGEMLLFTDKKHNVWQIVKRGEIDIVDNGAEEADEQDPNEVGDTNE
eukprot:TRINITY_DN7028_c0_g1_i13.p1 TRINITY_DN7028_c0_g1~~TRINITY_DN7028_c0_g1_i13.p1  ORF type:complete len:146 (+),score=79.12 TRINITY_DN7028_c0_g1_i13:481-918(+)